MIDMTDATLLNAGYAFAFFIGAMGRREYVVLLSLVSFRVTGSYVLLTILKQPFKVCHTHRRPHPSIRSVH